MVPWVMLDGLATFHPEDASTLGVEDGFSRLSRPDRAEEELAWLRCVPEPNDPLDRDALARWRAFHVRYLERDGHAENLELLLLPNAAMQHARVHGRDPSPRRAALPEFLRAQQANLLRGRRFDRDVAITFARHLLPAVAEGTGESLYLALARFVENEIVPIAVPCLRLGREETAFRLRDVMGIERSIDELLAVARTELERARARLPPTVADLFAVHPPSLEAAVLEYARHVDEATQFARAFLTIPADLALSFEPLPAGIADGTALTNWPALLLDPASRGHVLFSPNLADHAAVSSKNLAVHEAIPGHYLQSVVWQRSGLSPVRFFGMADDVALSRGYFGTMLAVEGWAVFVERLLFSKGFYDRPEEQAFFALCDVIRAVRVIVDLELHAGDAPLESLIDFASSVTHLSRDWAASQLLRARRMPLQQLTYLIGALELEALSLGPDHLLALGPVPPSRLRPATP